MKTQLLIVLMLSLAAGVSHAQTAEDLLQQALRLERTDGDYAGAIALYERVASEAGTDRRVTGRALIQLARAYENLGRSEAARTYQRVLADYADMPDLAAEARQGVARTRVPVAEADPRPEPMSRTVLTMPKEEPILQLYGASLSPSGRFFVSTPYGTTPKDNGIGLIEIATGERQFIMMDSGAGGEFVRFSPDEEQIVVQSWPEEGSAKYPFGTPTIVDRKTGAQRVLFDMAAYFRDQEGLDLKNGGSEVQDWSRDGKLVLVRTWGSLTGKLPFPGLGLLLLPVDGSPPRMIDHSADLAVVGAEPTYKGEDAACMSADQRFVFADYVRIEAGDRRAIIRRFDTVTGDVIEWRSAVGTDYALWSCTWDTDAIVYSENPLGDTVIRAAKPTDVESRDDVEVIRFAKAERMGEVIAGSKAGDIFVDESPQGGIFEFSLDPTSGRQLGKARLLDSGGAYLGNWSPSGDRVAWSLPWKAEVVVWSAEDDSRNTYEVNGGFGVRWDSNDGLWIRQYNPAADSTWTSRYDWHQLDLSSGAISASTAAALFNDHGLRPQQSIAGDPPVGWSTERGCLVRVDPVSGEESSFLCKPEGDGGSLATIPSPDGTRYLIMGMPSAGTMTFGVADRDGTGYRELLRGGLCGAFWGRPTEAIIMCGHLDQPPTFTRLDMDSGQTTEAFSEIAELFGPGGQYALSRDGRRLVVAGWPRSDTKWEGAVIHNVVGRK